MVLRLIFSSLCLFSLQNVAGASSCGPLTQAALDRAGITMDGTLSPRALDRFQFLLESQILEREPIDFLRDLPRVPGLSEISIRRLFAQGLALNLLLGGGYALSRQRIHKIIGKAVEKLFPSSPSSPPTAISQGLLPDDFF